jgi:hypothetical protein
MAAGFSSIVTYTETEMLEWNTEMKRKKTNGYIYLDGPQNESRLETGSLR